MDRLPIPSAWQIAVSVAVAGSVLIALWLDRDDRRWRDAMRSRLLFGVPWGTIVVCLLVLAIYLFVQDGWSRWDQPVFIPFVNWSYLYPTGVVLGSFTHASNAHLVGNLTAALVLGTLAEYAYGHYPPGDRRSLASPAVRAFVVFPGAVLAVGLLTSVFAWGAVIGFSGVVFAFAGFAVIRFPLLTVIALAVRSAIREVGVAIVDPVVVTDVAPTVTPPAWAGVAVQGHLLGFLLGAFLATLMIYHRSEVAPVDPFRVWTGVFVVGVVLAMWAIGTAPGEDRYVLYRGAGMAMIAILAVVLAWAGTARPRRRLGVSDRQLAIVVLAIPLLVMAFVAVPLNAMTVADDPTAPASVTVGDYEVGYTQNTTVGLAPLIENPVADGFAARHTDGVIVTSSDRHLWTRASTSGDLAVDRTLTVRVGGVTWNEDVSVAREGWVPDGADAVYRVTIETPDERAVFAADPQPADVTVDGHDVTIEANETSFLVVVTTPADEQFRGTVPTADDTAAIGGLTIERVDDRLVAVGEHSRVTIAERERPPGR